MEERAFETVLTDAQREQGRYMAAMALDEYPTLTADEVEGWNDLALQRWLYKELRTYLNAGDWVEVCDWCGGTGHHNGRRCDVCDGDGFREALDKLE